MAELETNDGIYDYASDEITIPSESYDKLAHITLSRFRDAVQYQGSELVGGKPVRSVLRECYEQYNGILSPRDREIVEAVGVDAYVNLSAMKSGLVQSFLQETMIQSNAIPWVISPTPNPELSDTATEMAAVKAASEIMANPGIDEDTLLRVLKDKFMAKQIDEAKLHAENMEKLITDQCLQGGWNRAMYGFISDFTVYPFAVLQGPIPTMSKQLVWQGDKLTTKMVTDYTFNSVSPWDFWYSPDSPDTQRGTGVFIRQRWTRRQLLDAAAMPSYNADAIKKVIEDTQRPDYTFRWMSANPDHRDDMLMSWRNCTSTIDVLIHYGFFSGRELASYGITDLDDNEFYNATITVVGRRTIQCTVQKDPALATRPIFATSFYKTADKIPCYSIPQRIRDIERAYLIILRYLVKNAAWSSGPVTEADYTRLSKYMSPEDLARIVPDTVYLASSDIPGGNSPALKFYIAPNAMASYSQMLSYFMDLVDRVSNIPAALHGTAVGSGANRTFRGAAMLQGNAVKAIQSAVSNIDEFVFGPMGQLLYDYNMIYNKDQNIKGDCRIIASGASGLLQREIDRQNSYEVLQLVGSAGQQIASMPNGQQIITWALSNVLKQMGAPKDLLATPNVATPQGAGMAMNAGGQSPVSTQNTGETPPVAQ
jgi:hypothetical protein